MMLMQRFLNPQNDIAFKKIFGTEVNKDILISLLNGVLNKQFHRPIVDVKFLNPFQEPEALAKKQSIVDVLCQDSDGCQYIIEMQIAQTSGFEERAQYYAYKAFISQMNRGDRYEGLKEVIFLAFTNFSIFPDKKHYKSEHVTLDRHTLTRDLDKLSFTFVDLVKFDAKIKGRSVSSLNLEEKFYYFLRHADETRGEELSRFVGKDDVLGKAYSVLEIGRAHV